MSGRVAYVVIPTQQADFSLLALSYVKTNPSGQMSKGQADDERSCLLKQNGPGFGASLRFLLVV
jgi:hypothetical protein